MAAPDRAKCAYPPRTRVWLGGALALVGAHDAAAQDIITGCVAPSGKITKVAIGDQPARPCRPRETETTLSLGGGDSESDVETVRFFVTLDGDGAEETIATHGPLEVFLRCSMNDSSIGADRMKLVVTSTVDGWWAGGFQPSFGGEEFDMAEFRNNGHGQERFDSRILFSGFHNSVIAPGGYLINLDFDELSMGLNIFDHDCLAAGVVTLIKGALD